MGHLQTEAQATRDRIGTKQAFVVFVGPSKTRLASTTGSCFLSFENEFVDKNSRSLPVLFQTEPEESDPEHGERT